LHRLNSGQFEESIFNFLKEKMDDSEPNKDFVNKVLWYWGVESYSDSIDHNNDKPFISPTDFSKVIQK
jgi:hypothetical protein